MSSHRLFSLAALGALALAVVSSEAAMADPLILCTHEAGVDYVTRLHITIETGGDDLRGGNDNVALALMIVTRGAPVWVSLTGRGGLNRGARWADWSRNPVDVYVPPSDGCPVRRDQMGRLRLTTTFGGGLSGDNWNMRSIHVDWSGLGAHSSGVLLDVPPPGHSRDNYVNRFTGDRRTWDHSIP